MLFPEAFVSAYPRGMDFGSVIGARSDEGREAFRRYWESSVDVPGPAVDELARTARDYAIYLVIGVVERDRGTLYCTVLFLAPDGTYLGKHRKVMPTGSEPYTPDLAIRTMSGRAAERVITAAWRFSSLSPTFEPIPMYARLTATPLPGCPSSRSPTRWRPRPAWALPAWRR